MATLYLAYDRVNKKAKHLVLGEADNDTLQKLASVEGYRWDREKDHATFPLKAVWAILYNAPGVHMSPGCRQWFDQVEHKMTGKLRAEIELVPEQPDYLKSKWKFRPYQQESVSFALSLKRCLWGMDTRLGKTLAALATHVEAKAERTIVVAPKSTLWNWPVEAAKFFTDPPKVTVVDGSATKLKKLRAIDGFDEGILVLNYETVSNTMTWGKDRGQRILIGGPLLEIPWDFIVVDEFHLIKTPTSQRAQAVRAIRPEWIVAMSGTPTPNGIHEIWSPLNYINPEFCPDPDEFDATYCTFKTKTIKTKRMKKVKDPLTGQVREEPVLKDIHVLDGYTARVQELHHMLRLYMRRYKYWDMVAAGQVEGYQEIPDYVGLTPPQAKAYKQVVNDKGYWYTDKKGEQQFQDSPLAIGTRLKRICASMNLIDEALPIASEKIDRMVDRALTIPEPQVCLTQFPRMAQLVDERLRKEGIETVFMHAGHKAEERDRLVRSFEERGQGQVFVSTIGVCQVGIRLARANVLTFLDSTFVPAEMLQATRRILDVDKEDPVTIFHMISRGTIEERIHNVVQAKKQIIALLIDGEIPAEQVTSMFADTIRAELEGIEEEIGEVDASRVWPPKVSA